MPEEFIIRHCSPTLAGLKTGNLFTYAFSDTDGMIKSLSDLNKKLAPKGLRVLPLRHSENGKTLVYIYRPSLLERDLENENAKKLLSERGYGINTPERHIMQLIRKLGREEEFPHEIGLFLGYPPEDVLGFIENKAGGSKCAGVWKVYGDEEKAKKTFEKYRKCTAAYSGRWAKGATIERLTVTV